MDDGFTIEIPSLTQALQELQNLPAVMAQRVLRGAVATGASVIRKEIIRRAPDSGESGPQRPTPDGSVPGTLKRAIYQVRNTQLCNPTTEVFKVGVRQGKRATKKQGGRALSADAFYASWVEYGHFARVPAFVSKKTKVAAQIAHVAQWVPAHPFFRPGVATSTQAAYAAMRDYIVRQLPLATAANHYLKAA